MIAPLQNAQAYIAGYGARLQQRTNAIPEKVNEGRHILEKFREPQNPGPRQPSKGTPGKTTLKASSTPKPPAQAPASKAEGSTGAQRRQGFVEGVNIREW